MTIQGGGGGGKKIPPGGTPPKTPPAPTTTPATKAAPPTTTNATTPTTPAQAPDAFERAHTDPRLASERAHLPPALETTTTTSGIDSMVRVLEETRSQILDEHKLLRERSIRLVSELARAGWERALVEQKRQELSELRERLANLRKRLQHIQRRLKTALSKSQKHGAVDGVNKALAAHLEKMKKLEPGVQKALLALVAMEQAFAGNVDGGVLQLLGDSSAEERGSALARLSPGSVIARATTSLLRSAVLSEGRRLSASTEGAALDVAGAGEFADVADVARAEDGGLGDVVEALLTSFEQSKS